MSETAVTVIGRRVMSAVAVVTPVVYRPAFAPPRTRPVMFTSFPVPTLRFTKAAVPPETVTSSPLIAPVDWRSVIDAVRRPS